MMADEPQRLGRMVAKTAEEVKGSVFINKGGSRHAFISLGR
jgi:hypothetical protein